MFYESLCIYSLNYLSIHTFYSLLYTTESRRPSLLDNSFDSCANSTYACDGVNDGCKNDDDCRNSLVCYVGENADGNCQCSCSPCREAPDFVSCWPFWFPNAL